MKKNEFHKAKLLDVRWNGMRFTGVVGNTVRLRPIYHRLANAGMLMLPFVTVTWRLPWLPQTAYSKGWNAGFCARDSECPECGIALGPEADAARAKDREIENEYPSTY